MPRLMMIAGEVSGDMYAAALIEALQTLDPALTFHGIGGDACQAVGMELFHHTEEMAIIGLPEVFRRYPFLKRVLREMTDWVRHEKPAAVILIDYPGFNLRLAARIKALGVPVIYYVCPQVWAWHRARIGTMATLVDRLITIFPFEAAHFSGTGLPVTFAGHPLVDAARAARALPPAVLPWVGPLRIALLPGSRRQEIEFNLPVMLGAARLLEQRHAEASFLIAAPSAREQMHADAVLSTITTDRPARLAIINGQTREVLRQATAAMVASGTATIETALMDCPMVIVYKMAALTYGMGRLLIRVPHIGMVNIIAGREICPELLQHEATPERLARHITPLLSETPEREAMRRALAEVRQSLGDGGAHARAAAAVLDTLNLTAMNQSVCRAPHQPDSRLCRPQDGQGRP